MKGPILLSAVTVGCPVNQNSSRSDLHLRAYTIGSASQDYITNTHHKYFPCPQSKLVNIILGSAPSDASNKSGILRPRPHISVQPDWMDMPYGIHSEYPLPLDRTSHLALHPGMVQHRNHLLATVALNGESSSRTLLLLSCCFVVLNVFFEVAHLSVFPPVLQFFFVGHSN